MPTSALASAGGVVDAVACQGNDIALLLQRLDQRKLVPRRDLAVVFGNTSRPATDFAVVVPSPVAMTTPTPPARNASSASSVPALIGSANASSPPGAPRWREK
jgi:hypothetical protein